MRFYILERDVFFLSFALQNVHKVEYMRFQLNSVMSSALLSDDVCKVNILTWIKTFPSTLLKK